jgi:hypothetical protein
MGRLNNLRNRVAELVEGSRDEEPEPQGYQGNERSTGLIRGGVLEHEPDRDDLNYYRQIYENVGPIKSAVDNYSSEVIEPGWYITADNDETAEQLTEYFRNVGIINHETDQNASILIEHMVREREIRGTVFLEKVQDSQGRNQALYPLQNDTITIYTKPGKAMLPAPDGEAAEPFDSDITQERTTPPTTDDGELAAYVQFDDLRPQWSATGEVKYTRNDVIKWVRDADIGDPRGTSRIASSARRAEGLLEKLEDNDDAVKFKAWPQIIFELGNEDNPWSEEEVNDFIQHYEEGNMRPGLMQAVAGDVDIEEFAGETADIEGTLNFDISMIMSGLPGPVYATGGFSQNVAPAVAQAQQRQFVKEVKKTRREIEAMFTPYLREVAEDYGLDAADSVELHLGQPPGHVAPEDIEGSIIRYTSDVAQGQQDGAPGESSNQTTSGQEGGAAPQPGATTGSPTAGQANPTGNAPAASQTTNADTTAMNSANLEAHNTMEADTSPSFRGEQQPNTSELDRFERVDSEELADPRLVSTADIEDELSDFLYEELLTVRERLTETLRDADDRPLRDAEEMDRAVTRAFQGRLDDAGVDARTRDVFEDAIESTLDTLGQDNHSPTIDVGVSARHRQRARFLSSNMADNFENAADDMLEFATVNLRQAVQHGESPQWVADRLENSHTDQKLRNRANTMARTEIMSAVNSLKMAEYDRHEDIVGVKLINPCNANTTPLCENLACDDHAEAMFDSDETLGEQFQSETRDALLFDGFDPLPTVPPFHFNCRTEIIPVTENE